MNFLENITHRATDLRQIRYVQMDSVIRFIGLMKWRYFFEIVRSFRGEAYKYEPGWFFFIIIIVV